MQPINQVLLMLGGSGLALVAYWMWADWLERKRDRVLTDNMVSAKDVELGLELLRTQIRLDALFLAEPVHQRKHAALCVERERRIRGFSAILAELGEKP